MSGDVIKQFLVGLGYEADEASMKKFAGGIAKATALVAGLGAAAVAAAVGITKFVEGTAEDFDKVSDLGGRVNATASELLRYNYIANLTDSSSEAVASSFDRLNRTIGEAAKGVGRGAMAFKAFGLSAENADGSIKNTSQVMKEVGALIKDMSRAEQVAVLEKLGIDSTMVGMLTTDVSALGAEFDALYGGVGIDADKAAQASSDFMDVMFKFKFMFKTVKDSIAIQMMPFVKNAIEKTMVVFTAFFKRGVPMIKGLIDTIVRISAASGHWVAIIGAVAVAWKLLSMAFAFSPLGAVITLVLGLSAALMLLYDDFMTWKEGGKSLIDWGNWTKEIDIVIGYLKLLWDFWDMAVSGIVNAGIALVQLLTGDLAGAWETVMFQVEKVLGVFNKAKDLFGKVGSYLGMTGPSVPDVPPAAAAGVTGSGGQQNLTATTNITVQGAANPEATARAVAGAQGGVNKNLARNLATVTS